MKILLVEDDIETARFIEKAMRETNHLLHHEDNGADGFKAALEGDYQVIIADRMLPRMDGVKMITKLRESEVYTPVLILSAMGETLQKIEGLKAGGDDYLTKPFSFAELLARTEALARRQPFSKENNPELKLEDLELNRLNREVHRNGTRIELNAKEFMILEYLMQHINQVVTRTMLLENVWDYNFDPQTNVIDVHISRLRSKIDKDFDPPLLHTKRGVGYILSVSG